jgi:hypothetical protein
MSAFARVAALAGVFLLTPAAGMRSPLVPDTSSDAVSAAPAGPADCSIVSADEIAQLLGVSVSGPDSSSRGGGICFFPSMNVTTEGSATYAIVTRERLEQRRAYYAVLARRCAGVQPGASNEFACKSFVALAQAKSMDDYFAARTSLPNGEAVNGLGDAAAAAGDALYVKRGDQVFEVVVRRGETLDVPAATALAKLLLARVPPAPASKPPEPGASPRRPSAS